MKNQSTKPPTANGIEQRYF